MSDIFANTTIFSEQEIYQNWFEMSNKIERFEPNYQPWVFDESLIIKNEDHIEVHANSFFNKDASFNTYRENTQVQRKSSEELWSLCDLTSQDDVYCINKEYNKTITIHESAKIDHQKSKLSGDDLDRFNKKFPLKNQMMNFT